MQNSTMSWPNIPFQNDGSESTDPTKTGYETEVPLPKPKKKA
jgi:hypothetical protein